MVILFVSQDQWPGSPSCRAPAGCDRWRAGEGVGWARATMATGTSPHAETCARTDQDCLSVRRKKSSLFPQLLSDCYFEPLCFFTLRDIHRQLWNIQGLSAAVKAWIASAAYGKGTIRADSWAAMVTLINPSNFSAVKIKDNTSLIVSLPLTNWQQQNTKCNLFPPTGVPLQTFNLLWLDQRCAGDCSTGCCCDFLPALWVECDT